MLDRRDGNEKSTRNEMEEEIVLINEKLDKIETIVTTINEKIGHESINMGKYGILVAVWVFLYQKLEDIHLIIITLLLGAVTIYFIWKDKELIKKELKEIKNRFEGSVWIILIAGLIVAAILIFILENMNLLRD